MGDFKQTHAAEISFYVGLKEDEEPLLFELGIGKGVGSLS
jgi:hypothetical protein